MCKRDHTILIGRSVNLTEAYSTRMLRPVGSRMLASMLIAKRVRKTLIVIVIK